MELKNEFKSCNKVAKYVHMRKVYFINKIEKKNIKIQGGMENNSVKRLSILNKAKMFGREVLYLFLNLFWKEKLLKLLKNTLTSHTQD
jgi:hypothetical protein